MRFSLEDDITDRQLEHGAIYCGRFTPVFEPSLRDDRYIPEEDLFVWTPPERDRYLDGPSVSFNTQPGQTSYRSVRKACFAETLGERGEVLGSAKWC